MWIESCVCFSLCCECNVATVRQRFWWDQTQQFIQKDFVWNLLFFLFLIKKTHLSMHPFVHCMHVYKAFIHFIRDNVKKFYQMHFLFIRKEFTMFQCVVIVLSGILMFEFMAFFKWFSVNRLSFCWFNFIRFFGQKAFINPKWIQWYQNRDNYKDRCGNGQAGHIA